MLGITVTDQHCRKLMSLIVSENLLIGVNWRSTT